MPTRKPAAVALMLGLVLALAPGSARADDAGRARSAYAALQKHLYIPGERLYRGSPFSYVWPFSQTLSATVAMGSLPRVGRRYDDDVRDRIAGLDAYWNPAKQPPGYEGAVRPPRGRGGDIAYDDNAWIGLELLRRYRRSHAPFLLSRAQALFRLIVTGWDADPAHPCPGGVPFSQAPDNADRNTVSNAPSAELGLHLYAVTRDPAQLDWSMRLYGWVQSCMRTPAGLYNDHIAYDGRVDQTIWSYNQGTMIGADVLLWRVTGKAGYLRRARAVADAALAYFTPARMRTEPPYFAAIFFDNLLALDAVRPRPAYRQAARTYADWAWRKRRDARTGLFDFGTDGGRVLEQAAIVRIYATLAGADSAA
jgi:hypothetical protein